MGRNISWRISLVFLGVASALSLLFQNCTNATSFMAPNLGSLSAGGGNGDGYAGIIYRSSSKCGDGTSQAKIKLNPDRSGLLIKQDCMALANLISIPAVELLIDQPQVGQLTYHGLVFEIEPSDTNSVSFVQFSPGAYIAVTQVTMLYSSPMTNPSVNGNLVVCSVLYNSPSAANQILNVIDSLGNSYIRAASKISSATAGGFFPAYVLDVWYAENIVGGNGLKVYANYNTAIDGPAVFSCFEYSGVIEKNALDQIRTGFGTNEIDLGTVSTNWNNQLVHVSHFGNDLTPDSLPGFQMPRPFPDSSAFIFIPKLATLNYPIRHLAPSGSVAAILTFKAKDRP